MDLSGGRGKHLSPMTPVLGYTEKGFGFIRIGMNIFLKDIVSCIGIQNKSKLQFGKQIKSKKAQ
jgi:hypothetical protein